MRVRQWMRLRVRLRVQAQRTDGRARRCSLRRLRGHLLQETWAHLPLKRWPWGTWTPCWRSFLRQRQIVSLSCPLRTLRTPRREAIRKKEEEEEGERTKEELLSLQQLACSCRARQWKALQGLYLRRESEMRLQKSTASMRAPYTSTSKSTRTWRVFARNFAWRRRALEFCALELRRQRQRPVAAGLPPHSRPVAAGLPPHSRTRGSGPTQQTP